MLNYLCYHSQSCSYIRIANKLNYLMALYGNVTLTYLVYTYLHYRKVYDEGIHSKLSMMKGNKPNSKQAASYVQLTIASYHHAHKLNVAPSFAVALKAAYTAIITTYSQLSISHMVVINPSPVSSFPEHSQLYLSSYTYLVRSYIPIATTNIQLQSCGFRPRGLMRPEVLH